MERLLLRVEEAAEMLGLGRTTVYEMAKDNQLPVLRVGRALRIPLDGLRQWIDEHATETTR